MTGNDAEQMKRNGRSAQAGAAKIKGPKQMNVSALNEKMAATYSRGSYTTTTIGNAAFDGRVRNGIGSDHSFMATIKF
jgi:hypothetical protein